MDAIDLRHAAQHVHPSLFARSRYRGSPLGMLARASLARSRCCGVDPSLGIARGTGSTDMSHLFTARSLGRGASLTLGGDKPVIPRVAFIR
jgi:hypothetical protein